mgnify:CR=1 FL=1
MRAMRDMPGRDAKRLLVESLRRDLSRLESGMRAAPRLTLGAAEIDRRLAGLAGPVHLHESACDGKGGLSLAGLHEVAAQAYPDMGAAAGFMVALGARLQAARGGTLVWITQAHRRAGAHDTGMLYGPGLAMLGLDPDRLLLVEAVSDAEALWAAEEALAAAGVAGAVAELSRAQACGLTASRRLHLAAEKHTRPVFILPGHVAACAAPLSVALTRFRVRAAPSLPVQTSGDSGGRAAGLGRPRFSIHLERVRGGVPFHLTLEWDHAACRFAVAAPVRDRAGGGLAQPAFGDLALTG